MKNNRLIIATLSLVVPRPGQMPGGEGTRGALILIAVIIVGNLNVIWLSVYSLPESYEFMTRTFPRFLYDLFAFYGVIFWIWQVRDAWRISKNKQSS